MTAMSPSLLLCPLNTRASKAGFPINPLSAYPAHTSFNLERRGGGGWRGGWTGHCGGGEGRSHRPVGPSEWLLASGGKC